MTSLKQSFGVAITIATLPLAASLAQSQLGDATTHDRIAAYFRTVPQGVMPMGDTLVTWRPDGPILYHTAQRVGNSVRAGMFRNDALIGTATVEWGSNAPRAFSVVWLGNSPLNLEGRVDDKQIVVTGSRQHSSPVPAGPWAIAEFGMDDLLLPLIGRLGEKPQAITVFRPFAGKWDTLSASVTRRGEFHVLSLVDAQGKSTWCATDAQRQSCLWIQQSGSTTERRPLDGTPAFKTYSQLQRTLGKLP